MNWDFHTSVLVQEVLEGLRIQPGKKYIDATLGGGGHGVEIVKRGGVVLGIDVDQDALEYVKGRWKQEARSSKIKEGNLILAQGNFADLGEIARANGFDSVAGVLFDLGVSSHQLTIGERGFSFQKDGPLDMRMNPLSGSATAADLVNGLYEHELSSLFEKYGQEKHSRAIARAIVRARALAPIKTTGDLARVIESVYYGPNGATSAFAKASADKQVFQALRIAVNDELGSLEKALPQAVELLEGQGRIAIISFHSLEDRIVKQFFRRKIVKQFFKGHEVTKKPIMPSEEEVARNPRSRSAKLRIYAKDSA